MVGYSYQFLNRLEYLPYLLLFLFSWKVENKKLQKQNKNVLSKYNQHLKDKTGKSTCSFDRNSTLPRASENQSGWVYKKKTTTETNDEKNKFYHPSGVNYRMLEDK